ncbi:MAG: site-specific integrase [Bdellovibrionota bacterium]
MNIKFDPETEAYSVSFSKRNPITRQPVSLRRKGIKSKVEAQRVYRELVIEVEKRIQGQQIPTWELMISEFLEDMRERGLLERTIHTYGFCLRAHTLEEWGERLINEITTHEIRILVQKRVGHKSVAHQQNLVKFIKAVFVCAIERGYIKSNPTPRYRFKISDRVKKVLTEEQVKALLLTAKEFGSEWYETWVLAVYTGLRSGELYSLTWDKINFETKQITVDTAWNSKDGFKSTKSGHERVVPINEHLLLILKELKLSKNSTPFVLPRNPYWDKGGQAKELQKFLIGHNLPPIRFHDLRATWATMLLGKGVPPAQVMKMGGWKDMTTMMIYMRMAGIDVQGATDCLNFYQKPTDGQVLSLSNANL